MWIDPADSNRMLAGSDGGIHWSYDAGKTWDFLNIIAIGQFYEVALDNEKPYHICGGLQDNGSWCGPVQTLTRDGIVNDDWQVNSRRRRPFMPQSTMSSPGLSTPNPRTATSTAVTCAPASSAPFALKRRRERRTTASNGISCGRFLFTNTPLSTTAEIILFKSTGSRR